MSSSAAASFSRDKSSESLGCFSSAIEAKDGRSSVRTSQKHSQQRVAGARCGVLGTHFSEANARRRSHSLDFLRTLSRDAGLAPR